MNAKPFQSGKWRGYADEAFAAQFHDLDQWLADNPGEVVVSYASREVRRVTLTATNQVVYLKIIRGLTDAGFARKEWFSWCKWVFRPSRAIHTMAISEAMLDAGFLCAVPLLAARRRDGIYPTDIFVSADVNSADLWQESPLQPPELVTFLAEQLNRFHQAGFAHGDCILRNLALRDSQLVYLDNDRTWRPPALFRRHYQKRNLAQLSYSILKRYKDEGLSRLFLDQIPWISPSERAAILSGALARFNRKPNKTAKP